MGHAPRGFRSGAAFRREALPDTEAPQGVLLAEPRFRVRAAFLEHGIPCLGFALEEKVHVSVLKNRLAEIGLAPGHWLNDLKRAIAEDSPVDTPIRAWWRDRNGEHAARAKSVVPFHFSPRYEAREAELVEELEAARRAAS